MFCFLLIFMVIDFLQTIYIRRLKKEIALRDSQDNKDNDNEKQAFKTKKKNRAVKLIKEIFGF